MKTLITIIFALSTTLAFAQSTYSAGALKVAEVLGGSHARKVLELTADKYVDDEAARVCEGLASNKALALKCMEAITGKNVEAHATKVAAQIAARNGQLAVRALTLVSDAHVQASATEVCEQLESATAKFECLSTIVNRTFTEETDVLCGKLARLDAGATIGCLVKAGTEHHSQITALIQNS